MEMIVYGNKMYMLLNTQENCFMFFNIFKACRIIRIYINMNLSGH